jgi:hypothetical protein
MNSFAEFVFTVFTILIIIGVVIFALAIIVAFPWLFILVVLFALAYILLGDKT